MGKTPKRRERNRVPAVSYSADRIAGLAGLYHGRATSSDFAGNLRQNEYVSDGVRTGIRHRLAAPTGSAAFGGC
ncbi:protein of unknown function [Nocardia cyriacigeorgica GUH-2]|uniref:Uncharacterized protein n=1 Tax=Nocardia cyriacigeorgica (strain GUH-2) TaxID=1127134 RepID=H6R2G2_NOCCG|nr:protein of unknown function [Nocardia cyriacigeorgica GUH-2]